MAKFSGRCSSTLSGTAPLAFAASTPVVPEEGVEEAKVIEYGKHKGLSYEECATAHPEYCQWILGQVNQGNLEHWRDFADFLQATQDGISVVKFGKYAGKQFQEVLSQDPQYCSWVLRQGEEFFGVDNSGNSQNFGAFVAFLKRRKSSLPRAMASAGRRAAVSTDLEKQPGCISSGGWLCRFGRHKGKTFQEIFREDRPYCEWLVRDVTNNTNAQPTPDALAFVVYIQGQSLRDVGVQSGAFAAAEVDHSGGEAEKRGGGEEEDERASGVAKPGEGRAKSSHGDGGAGAEGLRLPAARRDESGEEEGRCGKVEGGDRMPQPGVAAAA